LSHYGAGELLLVEKIVNTRDTTRADPEYLRTPADLARFLESWNFPVAQLPDAQDLADLLVLRQRLRVVFEAKDIAVVANLLNELLDGRPLTPQIELTEDGSMRLALAPGEDQPLWRRLAVEAALELIPALQQYGLERFHVCSAEPCTEVYIDTSRNHTRRFCCEQCANRHNVARYRQRQQKG
jgi:predicted RNA-binding Zn ribbon-like protein